MTYCTSAIQHGVTQKGKQWIRTDNKEEAMACCTSAIQNKVTFGKENSGLTQTIKNMS